MVIAENSKLIHWNYFLSIEDDVDRLARFIEFTSNNFSAHSIEMARILFAAASEVDVVAKMLCTNVNSTQKAENINDYKNILDASFPKIKALNVFINRYGLTLTPWDNWKNNNSPDWWRSYNKVKHERNNYFQEANLKNALNAVAGLYLLLLHLHEKEMEEAKLKPCPKLFGLDDKLIKHTTITEAGLIHYYDIK